MKNFKIFVAVVFLTLGSCRENVVKHPSPEDLRWLQGSWITDDSSSIETWALDGGELKGNSYSNREGKITEQLSIRSKDGQLVYEATVSGHNDGKTISFVLQSVKADSLHFSNPEHDFPTDIVYVKNPDNSLSCRVFSSSNKGMTLHMKKLAE